MKPARMVPTEAELAALRRAFESDDALRAWFGQLSRRPRGFRRLAVLAAALVLCAGKKVDFGKGQYGEWLIELIMPDGGSNLENEREEFVMASRNHRLHLPLEHQRVVLVIPPELSELLWDSAIRTLAVSTFTKTKDRINANQERRDRITRHHSHARTAIRREPRLAFLAEVLLAECSAPEELAAAFVALDRANAMLGSYDAASDYIRGHPALRRIAGVLLSHCKSRGQLQNITQALQEILQRFPLL